MTVADRWMISLAIQMIAEQLRCIGSRDNKAVVVV